MGQFHVPARLTGPSGHTITVDLLVDTGATFVVVPTAIAEALDLEPLRQQLVVLASGREEQWPMSELRIAIDDRTAPTPCFISPDGPSLLGAVALESLLLGVDPVAKRLVPVKGYAALTVRRNDPVTNSQRWTTGSVVHPRRVRSSARNAVVAVSSTVHAPVSITTP